MGHSFSHFDRQPPFIGRREPLGRLEDIILRDRSRIAIITGEPGTGKTALAVAFAEQHRDRFPGGIFVELLTERMLVEHQKATKAALYILDAAAHAPGAMMRGLELLLNGQPNASVIVTTTRSPNPSSAPVVHLDALSVAEASQLFERAGMSLDPNAFKQMYDNVRGNPALLNQLAYAVESGYLRFEMVSEYLRPFERSGLLGPDGQPLKGDSSSYKAMIADVVAVNDELLRTLRDKPELIFKISPRRFEEVIAELLARHGYDVSLTPASRDGGKDIYAAQKGPLGTFLYLVECKQYAPHIPVGIAVVQRLYGPVQAERANAGIVVTTSRFSKDATDFQSHIKYQLSLQDYLAIQGWLRSLSL